MMEDKRMVIVRTVVCVLGLLSVGTGIGAELKLFKVIDRCRSTTLSILRSQNGQPLPQRCVPLTSPPFLLGFTAAMALAIAHAIINVEAGCFCCRRAPRPSCSDDCSFLALQLCFLSWSTFVLAFLLLLTGGALLDGENFEDIFSACYLVTSGVFLAGASFFLSVCAGMLYYCITVYPANTTRSTRVIPPDQAGIELGQTRLPAATAQDPVFVH